jgi:transcriptional regulator with XRE-family HTH domain
MEGKMSEQIREWLRGSTHSERHEWMADVTCRHIAEQIKGLRLRDGLTQEQLADALGTKQPVISLWESGTYQGYSVEGLTKIANFFDVALIIRFVGWDELIAFTPAGVVTLPAKFADSALSEEGKIDGTATE